MSLANYTELQASIASWLDRTDLTAIIPDLITLCEGRIARDLRLREQIANYTADTTAGTQTLLLPTDILEIENITNTSSNPPTTMSVITPEIGDRKYPNNYWTGQPVDYWVLGLFLYFGPTPDAAYTISLDYYKRIPALSVQETNFLLERYPAIYLFGSLAEASAFLDQDDARIARWEAKYKAEVDKLQSTDDALLRSGSAMRVRVL